MLNINSKIEIPDSEISIQAVRAQGAGGQNVNKVSTAIHLRFDIDASSLPDDIKQRLLTLRDQRISADGVIVIKAQRFRSQEQNRDDALNRLRALIRQVSSTPKKRKPTKPSKAAKQKRVDQKVKHGQLKNLRRKIDY